MTEALQRLSTKAWKKHSGIIAADVSEQAWHEFIVAIEAVDNIRNARDRRVEAGLPVDAVDDVSAAGLAPMLKDDLTTLFSAPIRDHHHQPL